MRLASRWGKAPVGTAIGETWEVWRDNRLADGRTLGEAAAPSLLVKLIDTSETLSVQVHPDRSAALAATGSPQGKAEAWVVLAAEPGARVACGLVRELSAEELRARALSGELVDDLAWIEVAPGQVIDVPPGTIHAIGAGVTLYEVQEPSEITWRLFDWGRGRELHLDAAVRVARRTPASALVEPISLGGGRTLLVERPEFRVVRLEVPEVGSVSGPGALTVVEGVVSVDAERLEAGESLWLTEQAALSGRGAAIFATSPG